MTKLDQIALADQIERCGVTVHGVWHPRETVSQMIVAALRSRPSPSREDAGNMTERMIREWIRSAEPRAPIHEVARSIADAILSLSSAPKEPVAWQSIETAPKDQMFIWAYRLDGRWRLGLAYRNVSGGWSDAYGADAPRHATHWAPLPEPPCTQSGDLEVGK